MSRNTCGWSYGGAAPSHMNSLTPMSMRLAPASFWKWGTALSAMARVSDGLGRPDNSGACGDWVGSRDSPQRPALPHFSSDGIDIAYRDLGDGDPILLIHGFASNSAVNWVSTGWTETLVGDGRRVVAMDVRGHGDSAKLTTRTPIAST